jgi:hypothetical protein
MLEEFENNDNTEAVDKTETVDNTEAVNKTETVDNAEAVDNTSEPKDTKSSSDKHWYVLRVMGGKEKKTVSFIEKEIDRLNMRDHVSKILVPTEKVYQIRNGKKNK